MDLSLYNMEMNIKKIFGVERGINGAPPWITSALSLPDERILLADSNNCRILLYDEDGNLLHTIPLDGNPRDVVLLDKDQIVMTLPNELMIQFFNLGKMKVTKTVHVGYECFGITRIGELLVTACGTHLITLDIDGTILKITVIQDNSARYICSDENKYVYFTGWKTDTIHSISPNGKYSIMHADSSLKYCRALVIQDQSLLVVGRWTHSICRFSLDGEQKETVLSKSDGLEMPVALTLSKNNQNKFLITNNNGKSVMICEMVYPSEENSKLEDGEEPEKNDEEKSESL